jgi:hypothetical protein
VVVGNVRRYPTSQFNFGVSSILIRDKKQFRVVTGIGTAEKMRQTHYDQW